MISLTAYEKLKSLFDQERTSASYNKPILPAWRLTSWTVRIKWSVGYITSSVKFQQWSHMWKSEQIWTFRGWLIVLHRSSLPAIASTFNCIFSLFDILFPAGVTKSGKVNGTSKENSPLQYTTFWDQWILIDKLEPPSICSKAELEI